MVGGPPVPGDTHAVHPWEELLAAEPAPMAEVRPSDLATFIYTGGTTGPSKGCMLSHSYHGSLSRQIGCAGNARRRTSCGRPCRLFHFNAIVTAVLGPLIYGGRAAIYRRFSVSNFWPEMNRTGATDHLDARHDGVPARPRHRPAGACRRSGAPEANTSLASDRRRTAASGNRPTSSRAASASTPSAAPMG